MSEGRNADSLNDRNVANLKFKLGGFKLSEEFCSSWRYVSLQHNEKNLFFHITIKFRNKASEFWLEKQQFALAAHAMNGTGFHFHRTECPVFMMWENRH